MPKFSFVIPCYKAADRIARVIGSILDQDYKDYEIICVLDGPDEDCERMIKTFEGVQCKVVKHGGACHARNEGLKLAKGEFVIFNDSDVYWRPGSLRLYKETLEASGADACYANFKFVEINDAHCPPDYDPYLLKIFNYIDTNNPIRREIAEKIGGWDKNLERWQDWDFWIRAEKAGTKIVHLNEITRDTELPKNADNISGKNNYVETFFKVRKKHKFQDTQVIMTSIAATGHALRVAKACGYDYWQWPQQIPTPYKAVYLLGMFPESIEQHVELFKTINRGLRDAKYIIHWIGTDVLHMRTMMPWLDIKNIRMMFDKYNVKHFAQSEQNAEEMRELGFNIEVLPLPVENKFEQYPLPEKFTVACYDHGGIDEKWHKWLLMEMVKSNPDIDFVFYGNKHAVGKENNTEWLGHVPIEEVIKKSSCLVRFTIHDGYPVAPVEFMWAGRQVITNVPDMPYTHHVPLGVVSENRYHEIKQLVFKKIREVKNSQEFKDFNNMKNYYEELLSADKFKARIQEELK